MILSVLIGVYFSCTLYYKNRFPRNVYINKVNIGGMTLKKADKKLEKADSWDQITIKSNEEEFLEIGSAEIDYKYIGIPDLPEIFYEENKQNWFLAIFNDAEYTTPILFDYNKDKLKQMIDGIEELDKELSNANIIYSTSLNEFVIEAQSYEIKLTKEEIFDLVDQAISKGYKEVNLEKNIEQPAIFEDNKLLIASKDKANEYLKMKIKYDFGDREELIDGPVLKDFISFNGTDLDIDRAEVKDYVARLARKYDTFGSNRKFKTSSGEVITTNGGSYGWLTHRTKTIDALIEQLKSGQDKTMEPIYSYEALIRNSDEIGDSYLEIDLKEQMVYVYINGKLKIKTEIVTGNIAKGNDTPTGVFPVNYKETDAILKGENYTSPVNYWIPFNKNIGLHDASWRSEFGGDIYENKGSNGCVNLPLNTAKTIFDLVYPGMPVIVH